MRLAASAVLLAVILQAFSCAKVRDPDTLVFLIESGPTNLDPRIGTDAQSARISQLIFSSLLRRNRKLELVPDLAEWWEVSNPTTYTFHLRRGVRFHDGRPLTASDVKFTFESILDGQVTTVKAGTYRRIARIETPDPYSIIFHLREANVHFPISLTAGAVGIVPQGTKEGFSSHPVGTGPLRFVSATPDRDVVLERNEEYFATPSKVSRVRFEVVPDAVTRALELQKGSADIALNAVTTDMADTLRLSPHLSVLRSAGTNYAYVAFNLEDPILGHRRVRQAIAHALDRESIIRFLWRGTVRPALSILPPASWAYEDEVARYRYDPAKAEQLLDQAGFTRNSEGVRFTLTYKTTTEEIGRLKAEIFQAQLRKVGIDIQIRANDFATFYADIVNGRFQLYSLRWLGANNYPDIFEFLFSSSNFPPQGANRGRYHNPRLNTLLDRARRSVDRDAQREIYSEVQRILAEDLPYIHLWHFDNVCIYNRRIRKVRLYPAGDYDFIHEIELKE